MRTDDETQNCKATLRSLTISFDERQSPVHSLLSLLQWTDHADTVVPRWCRRAGPRMVTTGCFSDHWVMQVSRYSGGKILDCARCSRAGARRKRDERPVRSTQHMGVVQRRALKMLSEHADSKKKGHSSCGAMEDRTNARAEQLEAKRINGHECKGFAEADTNCERATGSVFQKAEAFVKRRSLWIWQRTSSTGCSSICTRGPKTA